MTSETDTERRRLDTLALYRVLDTASERVFDDLTELAATICEAPISLVSLVDESRQWFKSRHGVDVAETPRSEAFCAHAILEDDIMVVEDAAGDGRFLTNPLVTGDMHIRFYAGAPLKVASGDRVGTLCVIDRKPRTLSAVQRRALSVLRDAVVAQLELRRAALDLRALQQIVPMCAWCRSVRRVGQSGEVWQPLHEYVAGNEPVTHGICPACAAAVSAAGAPGQGLP